MNRRGFIATVLAVGTVAVVTHTTPSKYRWRKLDEETPPEGSLVDLHAEGRGWRCDYFGKRTVYHDMIKPCGWNDGKKGMLVLEPKITTWRYAD